MKRLTLFLLTILALPAFASSTANFTENPAEDRVHHNTFLENLKLENSPTEFYHFASGKMVTVERPLDMTIDEARGFVPRGARESSEAMQALFDTYLDDGLSPFEALVSTWFEVFFIAKNLEAAGVTLK